MDAVAAERILICIGDTEDSDLGGLASTQQQEPCADGQEDMDLSAMSGKVTCYNCKCEDPRSAVNLGRPEGSWPYVLNIFVLFIHV